MKSQLCNLLKIAILFCSCFYISSCSNEFENTLGKENQSSAKDSVNIKQYDKFQNLWALSYYIDNQIYFDGQNPIYQNTDSTIKSEFLDLVTRLNNDLLSYPPVAIPIIRAETKNSENTGETPKGGVTTVLCGHKQLIVMISYRDLSCYFRNACSCNYSWGRTRRQSRWSMG